MCHPSSIVLFQNALLDWYDLHGRKDLVWQKDRSPYHVWLSEIMLQQTQVHTVIPYFVRFKAQFPSIHDLAQASEDAVHHLWSGLGYYSRASNLHKTAKIISQEYQGHFPQSMDELCALPGIGRSTAGAILSMAMHLPAPILDGNVKRVLTRYAAIKGWPGSTAVNKQLWQLATDLTPVHRVADYTQAIMDLGALVCKRRMPLCGQCPVVSWCRAYAQKKTEAYPEKQVKKPLPIKEVHFVVLFSEHHGVLLEKRPATGVWANLWSLPECPVGTDMEAWCRAHYGGIPDAITYGALLKHRFTHYGLAIIPVYMHISPQQQACMMAIPGRIWYDIKKPQRIGLPAPTLRIINQVTTMTADNTTIYCQKLKKKAPSLGQPPYPGAIGQRILEHISAEAWALWLNHQTMLINEYRLSLIDKSARDFLEESMVHFLFSDG